MKKTIIALGTLAALGGCNTGPEQVTAQDGTEILRVYDKANGIDVRRDIFMDPVTEQRYDCSWLGEDTSRFGEQAKIDYNTFASVAVDDKISIDRGNVEVCLEYKI
jgi:hypothetical protein